MRIYNLDFRNRLFLAPLSGYTNYPMRILCRRYGAELAYTEMLSATGLIRNQKNTKKLLERSLDDAPLIAQIFGSNPDEMALSAKMLEDEGFDGIDINMGCPVKKVVSKGAGAALMREPELASRIVERVCSAVEVPVSVKMRSGWDTASINADTLSASLTKAGACAVIIHPRTRTDMYRNKPEWNIFSLIRAAIDRPLIASGDIKSQSDISNLKEIGADAYMIGRAAVGRPWIFTELTGGAVPDATERLGIILEHLDLLCRYLGQAKALRYMRKFVSSYVKGMDGASYFRQKACMIDDRKSFESFIRIFFMEQA